MYTDLSLTSDICGPSLVSYACLSYFESDPRGHACSCHAGKMCDTVIAEGAGKIRDGKKVRKRSACAREVTIMMLMILTGVNVLGLILSAVEEPLAGSAQTLAGGRSVLANPFNVWLSSVTDE